MAPFAGVGAATKATIVEQGPATRVAIVRSSGFSAEPCLLLQSSAGPRSFFGVVRSRSFKLYGGVASEEK